MKNDVAWAIAISKVSCSALAGLARQDLVTYTGSLPRLFPFRERRFSVAEFYLSLAVGEMVEGGVPEAYKDFSEVVDTADDARLARMVAWLEPMMCVKG